MIFCIGGGSVALAGEVTLTTADYTWEANNQVEQTIDDVTFNFKGGSAVPAYYSDGLRTYEGCVITISSESNITKIDFTYTIDNSGNLTLVSSEGKWTSSSKSWTGYANSVALKVGHSSGAKNGQVRITKIVVTTEASTSPTLKPSESSLSFGNVETDSNKDLTFKLTGYNLTKDAALSITGDNADMFSVSPLCVSHTDGTISETPITVKYKPTSTGSHTATLNISAGTEALTTVALSGTGIAPLAHHTVSWKVNGADYNEGTPSTDVIDGSKVTSLPTAPSAIYGKVFVGWTDTEISTSQDNAPSVLFNTASSAPAVTAKTTYYAVFASQSEGAPVVTLSQTLVYDTWTYSGSTTNKSSYRLFHANSYIESAEFDLSTLSKVVVYGGTFGGNSYNQLNIGDGTNTWKDVTVSGSSQTGVNTYTGGTALSGIGKLRITSKSGTASGTGVRISKVDIYTRGYTYSDYVTTVTPTSPTTNTLTITPGTNTFAKATDITMSATIDGTKIYYTTDGTEPSQESTLYKDAFKVTKTGTTVKAVAIADGYDNVTAEATYTIKPDQPVFSDESKIFKDAFDVTLSLPETTDATSKIHYAIGSTATAESEVYSSPINISSETDGDKIILHAVVVDEYGNVGTEKYCTYTKTTAAIFDFTQRPNVWNIEPTSNNSSDAESNVVGKELAVDGIVMTSTSGGSNITCIYASSTNEPNLRVYAGGTITFTAPEGYNISEIKFTGSSLTKFISNSQTYTNLTWTGEAHAVTFTADGSVQVKTASIKITPVKGTLNLIAVDNEIYYATFSSNKDVLFPTDVEVDAVSVSGTTLNISKLTENEYLVKADNTDGYHALEGKLYYVPANTGVLIQSRTNTVTYYYPYEAATVNLPTNQLKPAPAGGTINAEKDHVYYKLAYNNYSAKTGLGFYWGAENGGAFSLKAGTAYLDVTTNAELLVKGFCFSGTTTGINNIDATETGKTREIYNLAGQKVNAMTKAGLYIVNGKKIVIRK